MPHFVLSWAVAAIGTQFANAIIWLVVSLHFMPSLGRILRGRGDPHDDYASTLFMVGVSMTSYMVRWFFAGAHVVTTMPLLPWWVSANLISISAAVVAIFKIPVRSVEQANVRAKTALVLWLGVVVGCVGLVATVG